jgi:cation-transporting ATPase E
MPVALIVANGEMQSRGGWEQAIANGAWPAALVGVIASVIALIPLGLVLLSSVAFAVGAVRPAGNKVLVQELAAVEGLARVDVLCLDKTGTLTEGGIIFDGVHELSEPAEPGWSHALGWFAADPEATATSRCLETAFEHDGGSLAVSSVPFSSARKWSSVTFDGGTPGSGTWILGAPEVVLADRSGSADAALAADAALGRSGRFAESGLRTVVLAHAAGTTTTAESATLPAVVEPVIVLTFRE